MQIVQELSERDLEIRYEVMTDVLTGRTTDFGHRKAPIGDDRVI